RASVIAPDGHVAARAGGRDAPALQALLAGERQLAGATAFLRQAHGDGLAMNGDLATEAAADLQRHHLEPRLWQSKHARDHQLGRELALRRGPYGGKA